MSVVHHISGETITSEIGVNQECIDCLERLLQKAKDGEIVGIVAAAQYADGSTSGPMGGFVYNSRVIGELMLRIHRLSQ